MDALFVVPPRARRAAASRKFQAVIGKEISQWTEVAREANIKAE